MSKQDFTTEMVVDQTPKELFTAITNPQNWWTGEIVGSTNKLNDEFTYRYSDLHFSKQRIIELIPGQKVKWAVTDSIINYAEDKSEWTGTTISFEIFEKDNKTHLRFTHLGLDPDIECFESCSYSWTQIIQQSLFSLVSTGVVKKLDLG
jgi:hypothetical protein